MNHRERVIMAVGLAWGIVVGLAIAAAVVALGG
jgi:hypothetical protein